jgi:hypothetical protein
MFFSANDAACRAVTFTYVQSAEGTLAAFKHHLQMYLSLFRQLPEFRFLFLARIDALFPKAAELFRDLVTIPLQSKPADDLLRYFAIRKAWDLENYHAVTETDLIFRNLAKERFGGARFEHLYRAWKVGLVSDRKIQEDLKGSDKPHIVHFASAILKPMEAIPSGTPCLS